MKAIILAAERGVRMLPLTRAKPKCLLKLNDKTILEHQLENLKSCGIDDIIIITGHHADQIEKFCGDSVRYYFNPFYATTKQVASLWMAKNELNDELIIINGDMVFDKEMIKELLKVDRDICMLVEKRNDYENEDTKVRTEGDLVKQISKTDIKGGDVHGEYVGIIKFSKKGAEVLLKEAERLMKEGSLEALTLNILQTLIDKGEEIHFLNTDKVWVDIDFLEDFEKAKKLFPKL